MPKKANKATNQQAADSGANRHLIPAHAGQGFRAMPAGVPVMPGS